MAKKLVRTMAMIVMGRSLSRHGSVALSLQSRSHVSRQRVLSSTIALRLDVSGKATDIILPSHVQKWLDLELPEGRCVGVSMTEAVERDARLGDDKLERIWMQRAYHPDEIVYGNTLSGTTAESFWLGRLAMRLALDFPEYPILKDSYGRPALHGRWLGSISHKGFCGVALVAQSTSEIAGIGIDLEFASRPGKRSIAPRVLTERELQSLGEIPGVSAEEEVLLRFRYDTYEICIWTKAVISHPLMAL
jgi:hypothetical protein